MNNVLLMALCVGHEWQMCEILPFNCSVWKFKMARCQNKCVTSQNQSLRLSKILPWHDSPSWKLTWTLLHTEWRPGSTGQILSDLDLTSQKEGRWKRINTLAHYNVSTTQQQEKTKKIQQEGVTDTSWQRESMACGRQNVNGLACFVVYFFI